MMNIAFYIGLEAVIILSTVPVVGSCNRIRSQNCDGAKKTDGLFCCGTALLGGGKTQSFRWCSLQLTSWSFAVSLIHIMYIDEHGLHGCLLGMPNHV